MVYSERPGALLMHEFIVMDLNAIESALYELIEAHSDLLPLAGVEQMREFVTVGEAGIAFESFCTQLCECDVVVGVDTLDRIRTVGEVMHVDPSYWTLLSTDG
jgi:hypothetical protein